MNISIITPIFNEEKALPQYFTALNQLKLGDNKVELLLINDGSFDESEKIINEQIPKSKISTRLINLQNNSGWIIARQTGAQNAQFENLLFLDTKCEIFPDAIEEIVKSKHSSIIGTAVQKNNHIYDRFLFLIREKIYQNQKDSPNEIIITSSNFEKIPKGTTIFFCPKSIFLSCQPEQNTKNISDDIRLLQKISTTTTLVKSSKIKVFYNTRSTLKENLSHLMSRGPRFIDYYFRPGKKFFWPIILTLIFSISLSYYVAINLSLKTILAVTIFFLAANLLISLFLAKKPRDIIISFVLLPIFAIFFFSGMLKGLFLKIKNV